MLIVLSPIYLLIALIIFFSDFGNPFFKQDRLSRFNATISIYKFRSMKKKYSGLSPEQAFEKMGKPELAKKYRENGDMLKNDPRVTSIGKILRITSLDELPQLYNILRGDISLVGPYRPTWLGTLKRAGHVKPQDLAGYDSPIWPETDAAK
jgi:lipopolysaccharide/colanic/teichoic acid biosynthesis glycosyltransferase